ncbi:hypothetical protein TRVL_03971 [Trypanosoma vivax]|uniref:Uncharacterized protein n=1 Tax=Trypanosoma vivax (strain Y486) TaxID=1055687 RepID=G0TUK8_TRYVY|nr:hypothetical protein TRVL_03971 [Trypanosoma vivax]CCC47642.1 hypothetical protein, unlikely [Trypanosoma vivax Y486]
MGVPFSEERKHADDKRYLKSKFKALFHKCAPPSFCTCGTISWRKFPIYLGQLRGLYGEDGGIKERNRSALLQPYGWHCVHDRPHFKIKTTAINWNCHASENGPHDSYSKWAAWRRR